MTWMRRKRVEIALTLILIILWQIALLTATLRDYRQTILVEVHYIKMDWSGFPKMTKVDKRDDKKYLQARLQNEDIFNQPGGGHLLVVNH